MPTQEQLRKEQDPFDKAQNLEPAVEQALQTAPDKRAAEADHRAAAAERAEREKPAPQLLAEIPQQGGASDEAVQRLFNHFIEKQQPEPSEAEKDDKQDAPAPAADARRGRSRDPLRQKGRAEQYKTGIAADFVPSSKVVVGELDVPRRRRRGEPGLPGPDELAPTGTLVPEAASHKKDS